MAKRKDGLELGGVYKLAKKPEVGSQYVRIEALHKTIATSQFGNWDNNAKAFYPRTFTKGNQRVGKQAFKADVFAGATLLTIDKEFIKTMANKQDANTTGGDKPELEYVPDGQEGAEL